MWRVGYVPSLLCAEFSFSFQIFNAARQLSHTEAAPDKSGLVLLDYWVGLKRCLFITRSPRPDTECVHVQTSCVSGPRARVVVQPISCRILTIGRKV